MYDMLKPVDKGIEISTIKLTSKTGGKTDFSGHHNETLKCAVIVCSDTVSAGTNQDISGKTVIEKLQRFGLVVAEYSVIPDAFATIQIKAKQLSAAGFNLVLFIGGTGLSPRDVTPDAIEPLLSRNIPGIMEVARNFGQQRTPYAMLSRGVAGFIQNTLVLTLPGSVNGAAETIDAVFPYILHVFKVAEGLRHD
jgi:molybdenum cofactor synthesis domain-containing protein